MKKWHLLYSMAQALSVQYIQCILGYKRVSLLLLLSEMWEFRTMVKSKFYCCMHRHKCFCYSPLESILFVAFLRLVSLHHIHRCVMCDVISFRFYIGMLKITRTIRYHHAKSGKRLFHLGAVTFEQTNFSLFIVSMISNKLSHHYNCFIAVIVCIFLLSFDRSSVRLFIISFSFLSLSSLCFLPHNPVSILFIHMPPTIHWLYSVQSHIHTCTFIEFYSTDSQPPGQTIVNKQNNERKSTVIMQKATTNTVEQILL